ncbi:MAG: LPS-assembly protein LptD [Gemmatimonas sp.]
MPVAPPTWFRAVAVCAALALAIAGPRTAIAQGLSPGKFEPAPGSENEPVLLKADEITYDESLRLVTASGHVEIAQGDRVLLADAVSYNERTAVMTASGHVALMEPTGEVFFSEYAEFTNQMRDGVIAALRVLLSDNSRMAAAGGKRIGGTVTEFNKGVFSPCELCAKDPTRPPLWQVKAVRIVHDSDTKDIEYRDAVLEMAGIPVFYTPYLSMPDPTVKRRSGFLVPSFGHMTGLGGVTKTPYFWAIGNDRDVTLTPIYTSDQGPVMAAQYRQRFDHGAMLFDGSITHGDKSGVVTPTGEKTTRGHIIGSGRFDVDETWRTGFDVARATDATYMRRYGFGGTGNQLGGANATKELTTTAYVEGFSERDYAKLSGYTFQDLQANAVAGRTPLLLPLAQYNLVGSNDAWGGHTRLDTSILGLSRDIGTDSRRLSVRPSWQLPYMSSAGDITTFTALVQADAYHVNDVALDNGRTFDGATGRLFPQMMVDWRYPFARQHERFTEVLEPVAAVVAGPNGNNPQKIPNEDSPVVDFDDLNIMQMSRFPGVDRVEGGERVVYGLRWSGYGQNGASTSAFLGQSYNFQKHPEFGTASGIENRPSDVVGRVRVTPARYFDFLYRFRADADGGMVRRHEVGLAAGPSAVRFNTDYVFSRAQPSTQSALAQLTPGNREQISAGLQVRVNDHWDVRGQTVQDLTSATGGPLYNAGSAIYHDECLTFTTTVFRRYTSDRDLTPATGVFFSLMFKYLGDFESGQRPG